ncbi:MAG: hypothetical protein QOJ53_2487, partial [Sphingomonadales bacterium]|nr:hypothetical protein [Sphingomonadales bacterium]
VGVFGAVLLMWSHTEILMEMVLKREMDWGLEETSIICGPLGGGAKTALLFSLLQDRAGCQSFCEAVAEFQALLGRNALAHGFVTHASEDDPLTFVYREVKKGLSVKIKTLDRYLEEKFIQAAKRVFAESGFTEADVNRYGHEVAALAQPL